MLNAILGKKVKQTQVFNQKGDRLPVTIISVPDTFVVARKTAEKDGYDAVVLTYGSKKEKNTLKPQKEFYKKSGLDFIPRKLKEVRVEADLELKVGDKVSLADVLERGNLVNVTGVSKGKGFAGVVKRHGFAGGPKTHGQSDRQRAPGSIGATTTPGRVLKGKRMAGRMGQDQVCVKNLEVAKVDNKNKLIYLKGLVPGGVESFLYLERIGQSKDPITLFEIQDEEAKEEIVEALKKEQEAEEAEMRAQEEEKEAEAKAEEKTENNEAAGQPDSQTVSEAGEEKTE